MVDAKKHFLSYYLKLAEYSFYIFLFGTLSFGRTFSTFYIDTPFFSLFVTEIFLAFNMPLLFYKRKSLSGLPRLFLTAVLSFFVFGLIYLTVALSENSVFALRDAVIFV